MYRPVLCLKCCGLFMDIVIVLDGSNSIYPWQEVQNFVINIVKKFHIGPGQTRVGLVQYGETAVHEFTLSDYETTEQVVQAAKYIEQRGGRETRTAYAVNHASILKSSWNTGQEACRVEQ